MTYKDPEYKKKWAQNNKDKIKGYTESYRKNNPETKKESQRKYKAANKEKLRDYILNNYEWYLFNSARTRARNGGLEFTITVEDIIIPEICPYLKTPITRIQGQGRQDTNPSVDRINPEAGYVPGNIQIISDKANRMKNSASLEELVIFAQSVLEKHN